MKVKICGITSVAQQAEVLKLKPDFIGHIFYENSPRNCEPHTLSSAFQNTAGKTDRVLVTVDLPIEQLISIQQECNYDFLQLHGQESPEYLKRLKAACNSKLIKAVSIADSFDFSVLKPYLSLVDYFLFDTKAGSSSGGTGQTFDWNILRQYQYDLPFFLAGGIGLNNLSEVFNFFLTDDRLYAVDLNSQLESAPGQKDLVKVAKAVSLVRSFKQS